MLAKLIQQVAKDGLSSAAERHLVKALKETSLKDNMKVMELLVCPVSPGMREEEPSPKPITFETNPAIWSTLSSVYLSQYTELTPDQKVVALECFDRAGYSSHEFWQEVAQRLSASDGLMTDLAGCIFLRNVFLKRVPHNVDIYLCL